MTTRRTWVLSALASSLSYWTRQVDAASSKTADRVYRVGVIDLEPESHVALWNEFVVELARQGYVDGRNLDFERRILHGVNRSDELTKAANELVAAKVDVLFAARGTESALAAKNATKSVPIVFFSSADPVGIGLVASLSRPGGNITGSSLSSADTAAKNLQFLVEALGTRRLRVIQIQARGTRLLPWFPGVEASIAGTANRLGVQYDYLDVDAIAEIEPLLRRLAHEGVDAVAFESLSFEESQLRRIADLLIELRIPSIGDASAGLLFSYEPDWLQIARIAAQNVAKILRGTPPAHLPVQQPTMFELTVNLKTANGIGLVIPQSLLLRANEVIR